MSFMINTNKRYKVIFYDDTEFIIEFTNEDVDFSNEYFGYKAFECWSIGDDEDYDKKCILFVSKYDEYDCYIEIFTDDRETSDKQIIRELIELD